MNRKRRVCVVITARPSYARIKTALDAINRHPCLELMIVVAASALINRYGDVSRVILNDGFKIAAKALTLVEGENAEAMAKTVGLGIIEVSSIFSAHRPDLVVTIADRYETIATAISASYLNIPLIHIQGGEVTGNIDEKVRHSITKLADFHFVANEAAFSRVLRMGEEPCAIFNTGCPSIDLAKLSLSAQSIELSWVMKTYGGVGWPIDLSEDFIVVLQHPVTTEYADARAQVEATLSAVSASGFQALWFWPNPDSGSDGTSKGIRAFREDNPYAKIHFFKNMEPEVFLRLIKAAKCIVGNSSAAIRECAFLGIPAVNIGTRQANRERGGNVFDVDYRADEILKGIKVQSAKFGMLAHELIYGAGGSGALMADICAELPLRFEKKITL